ncbi:MAG: hypothetical protein R3C12_15265 [Planctomycetaceae bacterium]
MQQVFQRSIRECGSQVLGNNAQSQARVDHTPGLGIYHHPGFRLAILAWIETARGFIVGMHLHGKTIVAIEKFYQQRELREPGGFAEQFHAAFGDQAGQRPVAIRLKAHGIDPRAMIADFPTLSVILLGANRFSEQGFQSAPSPANPLQQRRKYQGFHRFIQSS